MNRARGLATPGPVGRRLAEREGVALDAGREAKLEQAASQSRKAGERVQARSPANGDCRARRPSTRPRTAPLPARQKHEENVVRLEARAQSQAGVAAGDGA